ALLRCIDLKEIVAPLENVACHLPTSPRRISVGIRRCQRGFEALGDEIRSEQSPISVGFLFTPGIRPSIVAASSLFPLGFPRQSCLCPSSKGNGFVETHTRDRFIGSTERAVVPERRFRELTCVKPCDPGIVPELKSRIAIVLDKHPELAIRDLATHYPKSRN